MKIGRNKLFLAFFLLVLVAIFFFVPYRVFRTRVPLEAKANNPAPVVKPPEPVVAKTFKSVSLTDYLDRLNTNGSYPSDQSVIVETLEGKVLIEHNGERPLNPASVMKLSTSYLALKHFGPQHKFKTLAYTNGVIEESKQILHGDLIIEGEGDPNFTYEDARVLGESIRSQGIRHVEGDLIILGPMRLRHTSTPEFIYGKLKNALGLTFPKPKKGEKKDSEVIDTSNIDPKKVEKVFLGVHYSQPLKDLLLYMNAHSDNYYAEQLGEALGGPDAVQAELSAEFNFQPGTLFITHTSGLDFNRITPKASLTIFQKMIKLLANNSMKVEEIMPVAGVDSGTLNTRFRNPQVVGSIVAKTGTLNVTDNGVSTLQGVVYSQQYGPLLFAIFNSNGPVHYFRKEQDRFLCDAISEMGIEVKVARTENILAPGEEDEMAESVAKVKVKPASARGNKKYKARAEVHHKRR